MMNNIREKLYRFMYGRYGGDRLNKVLLWVYVGFVLAGMIVFLFSDKYLAAKIAYYVIEALGIALIFFVFYRMFSRDIAKRRRENEGFFGFFKLMKNKRRDRKTHVYRKCPKCRAVLRLPKAKGKHTVVCPRCHERFEVRG